MDEHDLRHLDTDALWRALDEAEAHQRALVLVVLGDRLVDDDDYAQALPLAEAAIEAARAHDDTRTLALAHLCRGRSLFGLGRRVECVEAHLAGAEAAHLALDDDLKANALLLAADGLERGSEEDGGDRAFELLGKLLAMLPEDDHRPRGEARYRRARMLWRKDHNLDALDEAEHARHHFQQIGHYERVLATERLVADCLTDDGQHGAALEVVRRVRTVGLTFPGRDLASDDLRFARALIATRAYDEAYAALCAARSSSPSAVR